MHKNSSSKNNQRGNVNIRGDGNIVGDSNQVYIDNRVTNKTTTTGGSSNTSDGGSGLAAGIGGLFFTVTLVAFATWKFAAHSSSVYAGIQLTGLVLAAIQLAALGFGLWKEADWQWLLGRLLMMTAAGCIAMSAASGSDALGNELVGFAARAQHWKEFACGLTLYGRQIATLQLLAMCVFGALGLVALSWNTAYVLGLVAAVATEWSMLDRFIGRSTALSGVCALALALASLLSQSDFAFDLWSQTVFTAAHDPFNRDGFFACTVR